MRVEGKTIDIGRNVFHVTIKGGLTNDEIMKSMNDCYSAKYDNETYGSLEFRFFPGDDTYDWTKTGYQ